MNVLLGKETIENHRTKKLKQEFFSILFIEQSNDDIKLIISILKKKGLRFISKHVKTPEGLAKALRHFNPSIIITDCVSTAFSGRSALRYLKKHRIEVPVIVVTESQSEEKAIKCVKEGAYDYISKTDLSPFQDSIYNTIKLLKLKAEKNNSNAQLLVYYEMYEQLLKTLGEINMGFLIIDSSTKKIFFVNKTFCTMSGYEASEIFKLPSLVKLISSKNLRGFNTELAKVLKGNNPIHIFTSILIRKDNKKINVEFITRQFEMNNNSRLILIVRDVTEIVNKNLMKKLMEEALHESESRYRSLIENVKDYAIFMLDYNGSIISWNAGAERITGYKEKEIILKKFTIFFPENNGVSMDFTGLLKKSKDDGHIETEFQLTKKDGKKLWASVTITKLNNEDSESGIFSIIIRDLTKNKISEERLREQEIQLRSLAKHLQDAREEERQRIARELHDEFSQMLTVLRMDLTVLSHTISKTVTEPFKRISLLEKISTISELLEKTIRSTRRIITELRPAVLDELGLYTAIQWQAQEFENRTGIRCKILKLQYDINLDKHTSTAIFRILQEGLTNVAKHSHATSVVISLKMNNDKLLLEIKDNGRGIDKNKLRAPTSTGLFGIRERVMALNGNFEIHSEKDQGTRLVVSVPCKEE